MNISVFSDNDRIMKSMTSDRRFEYRHDCLYNAASSIKAEAVMLKRSLIELIYKYHGDRSGRKGKKRSGEEPERKNNNEQNGRVSPMNYPRQINVNTNTVATSRGQWSR